jgi:hypothetical protein
VHDQEDVNRRSEEAYKAFCSGIGMDKYSTFFLSNYISKFHQLLPSKENIPSEEIIKDLY